MKKDAKQNQPDKSKPPDRDIFSAENFDYPNDHPDDFPPVKTGKTAMIVAIIAAATAVTDVTMFFVYLLFFNNSGGDKSKSPSPAPPATETSASSGSTSPSVTEKRPDRIVIMPDLDGLSEQEAYAALNEKGIKFRVTREFNEDIELGYVISQSPLAGDELSTSTEALIYISKGAEDEIHTSPRSSKATDPSGSTEPSGTRGSDGDYLLPDSDRKKLKESDLASLDRETLNLALNEIFARHGRKFSDPEIKAYFESKEWYKGTVSGSDFDESVLNSCETYNINLIIGYQEKLGYR